MLVSKGDCGLRVGGVFAACVMGGANNRDVSPVAGRSGLTGRPSGRGRTDADPESDPPALLCPLVGDLAPSGVRVRRELHELAEEAWRLAVEEVVIGESLDCGDRPRIRGR